MKMCLRGDDFGEEGFFIFSKTMIICLLCPFMWAIAYTERSQGELSIKIKVADSFSDEIGICYLTFYTLSHF